MNIRPIFRFNNIFSQQISSFLNARALSVCIVAGLGVAGAAHAGDEADPRIGDEVRRICFASNIDGFRFSDDHRDAVLLEARVNDWYFVELLGGCRGSGLRFAQAIAIETRGSSCLSRGDRLIFSDGLRFDARDAHQRRCLVGKIYEWDDAAGGADGEDKASDETPEEGEERSEDSG